MTARPHVLRSPGRLVRVAMVAALAILIAGGIRAARRLTVTEPLAGVEIGMTPDDVRASFRPPAPGLFMVGSEGGEPLLIWHPRARGSDAPAQARFEFREGELSEARFLWAPGTRPNEAAEQLGLRADARSWDLGAGQARLTRRDGGALELAYVRK